MTKINNLRELLFTNAKWGYLYRLLDWDQEVNMPIAGTSIRGEVNALIAATLHKKMISSVLASLVEELRSPDEFKKLSAGEKVIVNETWRELKKAQKLPAKFVEEFTKITTVSFVAWAEARQKSDFEILEPYLKRLVKLNQQKAEYLGYKGSPYDALVDEFEPGMTAQKLDEIFKPLTKNLTGLMKQVADVPKIKLPKFNYSLEAQKKLNLEVVSAMGYDFKAGRIDPSAHPFTLGMHPTDVRITTRYDENDFWVSLGSLVHEVGHALYEQGLPVAEFGTPLGTVASLGIHESQSRVWENLVCRSYAFSNYLYPLMNKHFGKLPYSQDELYRWLNRIEPSLIRVESDEVSYNLHIVVRYELEKALIDGSLKVEDLPRAWNQKMKECLGVTVEDDASGVLQDVHWSYGMVGYFPNYSLGNLYSAQLFNKAHQNITSLDSKFSKGDFGPFLHWLRENIHKHGQRYTADELIMRISGEPLNAKYLIAHLQSKVDLQIK